MMKIKPSRVKIHKYNLHFFKKTTVIACGRYRTIETIPNSESFNGEKFNKFAEGRNLNKCAHNIASKSLGRMCDSAFFRLVPIQGAVLQIGRSLVRFQMVSLEFFIDIILPIALWPWGRLSL